MDFTPGCRLDLSEGRGKEGTAKELFKRQDSLPVDDIVSFSDGSEQSIKGTRYLGCSYVMYKDDARKHDGGFLDPKSHVFDAESIGAWRDLEKAAELDPNNKIWLCIGNISVTCYMRSNTFTTSRWAFLEYNCQVTVPHHY